VKVATVHDVRAASDAASRALDAHWWGTDSESGDARTERLTREFTPDADLPAAPSLDAGGAHWAIEGTASYLVPTDGSSATSITYVTSVAWVATAWDDASMSTVRGVQEQTVTVERQPDGRWLATVLKDLE